MLGKPVADYLQTHRDEHLSKFFELLRFASVANIKGKPDQCHLAAEWLAGVLAEIGFDAVVLPAAGKPNVIASLHVDDKLPTVLIYGHYDVQPADPLDLWESDPFEPTVRNGAVFARGASDNKGSHFAYIMATEASLRGGGNLPVNVKFFLEGEEEIGSPNLEPFVKEHAEKLSADLAVISDSGFFADDVPSITYALRGLAYFQVTFNAQANDAHSGMWGGVLPNPINALARMIAAMQDETGRIMLPGFYDDVSELSDEERQAWAKLPFDEKATAAALGAKAFTGGETGYSLLERRWARPTLDCNGIVAGYTDRGAKTIIPAQAGVKISTRLVANQDPGRIADGFKQFVADHTPEGMTSTVEVLTSARPLLLSTDSPAMGAAKAAVQEGFGKAPAMVRTGASVPAVEIMHRLVGLDAILIGFGSPSDNVHAPNERFQLDRLWRGSVTAAAFLQNIAGGPSKW
ncbi:MAG: dipeptidase [Phycisphaerae bacterium]|nr:dipeptidase [Phycisphaerae bacterium]